MCRGTKRTLVTTLRAGKEIAMNKSLTVLVAVLAAITLMTPSRLMAADTGVITKSIVSGGTWRVTDNPGPACPALGCRRWTDIGYDDSTWLSPRVSSSNGETTPESVLPGTTKPSGRTRRVVGHRPTLLTETVKIRASRSSGKVVFPLFTIRASKFTGVGGHHHSGEVALTHGKKIA